MPCFFDVSNQKSGKFSGKIKIVFEQNSPQPKILKNSRIIEGVRAKYLETALLFIYFSKAFGSIYRGKMEQIYLAYGFFK